MGEYGFVEGMMIGMAKKDEPGEKRTMVFDWDKAAQLIRDRAPGEVEAGLQGDWDYTGGAIYRDGAPVPKEQTYTYLASFWAMPQIEIDGERIDCFVMQDEVCGWDSGTYWPESALTILNNAA